jgi:hypothetical protein
VPTLRWNNSCGVQIFVVCAAAGEARNSANASAEITSRIKASWPPAENTKPRHGRGGGVIASQSRSLVLADGPRAVESLQEGNRVINRARSAPV